MTEAATLFQLSDCACEGLLIPAWEIQASQGWCVYGRNGSGKQLIDQLLVGELAPRSGEYNAFLDASHIALISFERQQATYEEEWRLAATDIIPEDEWGTRVSDFLPATRLADPLIDALNM